MKITLTTESGSIELATLSESAVDSILQWAQTQLKPNTVGRATPSISKYAAHPSASDEEIIGEVIKEVIANNLTHVMQQFPSDEVKQAIDAANDAQRKLEAARRGQIFS